MADNTPVLIHFEPGAVLPYPLSNSYAEHIVIDSRVREDLFCRDLFYSLMEVLQAKRFSSIRLLMRPYFEHLETSATGCGVLPK